MNHIMVKRAIRESTVRRHPFRNNIPVSGDPFQVNFVFRGTSLADGHFRLMSSSAQGYEQSLHVSWFEIS